MNEILKKTKKTDIALAVIGGISACVASAAIVTARMLTRQTHIQARTLQISEDSFPFLQRQTLAIEKQTQMQGDMQAVEARLRQQLSGQ